MSPDNCAHGTPSYSRCRDCEDSYHAGSGTGFDRAGGPPKEQSASETWIEEQRIAADHAREQSIMADLFMRIERLQQENDQLRQIALLNAETLKNVVAARIGHE